MIKTILQTLAVILGIIFIPILLLIVGAVFVIAGPIIGVVALIFIVPIIVGIIIGWTKRGKEG